MSAYDCTVWCERDDWGPQPRHLRDRQPLPRLRPSRHPLRRRGRERTEQAHVMVNPTLSLSDDEARDFAASLIEAADSGLWVER